MQAGATLSENSLVNLVELGKQRNSPPGGGDRRSSEASTQRFSWAAFPLPSSILHQRDAWRRLLSLERDLTNTSFLPASLLLQRRAQRSSQCGPTRSNFHQLPLRAVAGRVGPCNMAQTRRVSSKVQDVQPEEADRHPTRLVWDVATQQPVLCVLDWAGTCFDSGKGPGC